MLCGTFRQVAALFSCFPKCKGSSAGSCFLLRRIAGGASGRRVFSFESWDISTKLQRHLAPPTQSRFSCYRRGVKLLAKKWQTMEKNRNTRRKLKPRMDKSWSPVCFCICCQQTKTRLLIWVLVFCCQRTNRPNRSWGWTPASYHQSQRLGLRWGLQVRWWMLNALFILLESQTRPASLR